jgi:hypothetical protein
LVNAHHATALLDAGLRVHQNEWLAYEELRLQSHQSAVRIHHQGVRIFLDMDAVGRLSQNLDRYLQHHAFAAAPIGGIGRWHEFLR